nr:hypothetical protein [Tanacetum cinerariifolium]
DSECIVLGRDFKLLDDANILIRTPRQHNMYSIDLKNIVPHRNLTCLVAKASTDECMLWHRRLGKQHKASCKSKLVNSMTKPLHTLHMDLFGPTTDETSGILKKFITEIENLKDLKVKIIRNKTLIEAARTMLANAKLPVTFWAEVVNTACYVQNRVLVNKSHNKTPYELFNGRSHAIGFLKPFSCHVMILNALDNLGKFKDKGDKADQMKSLTVKTPILTVSSPVPTAYSTYSQEPSSDTRLISKRVANQVETPSLDNILSLTNRFEDILGVSSNSEESNGVEADISKMEQLSQLVLLLRSESIRTIPKVR